MAHLNTTEAYGNDTSAENFTNALGSTTYRLTDAVSPTTGNFSVLNFTGLPDDVTTSTRGNFSITSTVTAHLADAMDNVTFAPDPENTTDIPFLPSWWQEWQSMISTMLPVLYGSICFLGIVGNLLVILVLLRYSSMKTLPNVYILNLALADFLFMLTIPFIAYQFVAERWIFGYAMCKFVMSFDGMNQFTGVFLLTAMSLDRFAAFCYPMKSLGIRTLRNTRFICCLMWALSGAVSLPLWMYSETFPHPAGNNETICSLTWTRGVRRTFILYAFILGYVIPLLVICTCYTSIIQVILSNKQPGEKGMSKRGSKRVVVLVIAAVVTFSVCWLPFYALQIKFTFFQGTYTKSAAVASVISICLSYGNSAINPIVYTFVGRHFKESIARLLCCRGDVHRRSQSVFASSTRGNHIARQPTKGLPRTKYISSQSFEGNADVLTYDNNAYQLSVSDTSPNHTATDCPESKPAVPRGETGAGSNRFRGGEKLHDSRTSLPNGNINEGKTDTTSPQKEKNQRTSVCASEIILDEGMDNVDQAIELSIPIDKDDNVVDIVETATVSEA